MLSRTTTSVVTFFHPLAVAGYTDERPAGECEVLADEDVKLSNGFVHTDGLRRFYLSIGPQKSDLRGVDHRDLQLALAQDQADANKHEIKNSAAALSPSEDQK